MKSSDTVYASNFFGLPSLSTIIRTEKPSVGRRWRRRLQGKWLRAGCGPTEGVDDDDVRTACDGRRAGQGRWRTASRARDGEDGSKQDRDLEKKTIAILNVRSGCKWKSEVATIQGYGINTGYPITLTNLSHFWRALTED
ncbi:N-acetylglucosamine-regulated TonB-dependentouter membrane receptor [Striga asiatica]|uniref:N-acetylglucosamine-regulated TonB-dependentouter membrane receptor n=1 Tax=Striga asiatica TaxID=4170 RepID=A0A5A7R0G3_STRAF|nr:N-acetylglucosamine-regulated TonB-dependentouter membrane receptor [Striga asiatica]